MSVINQSAIRNNLLAGLAADDFLALEPYLKLVPLELRSHLVVTEGVIDHVWFVETGIVSVITAMPDGRQIEAGIVGYEGMVDVAVLNGVYRASLDAHVQSGGTAYRIAVNDLARVMEQRLSIRVRLALFAQTLYVQVAHTAFANATNTIEERLARWLLMANDRVSADAAVVMTHEFLSIMLGVRRSGVTVGMQALAADGAIRASRGRVAIINRERLIQISRGSYGPPETEYRRLFGGSFGRSVNGSAVERVDSSSSFA